MTEKMTIGSLAKRSGVNVQTVRYYERRRLLSPDSRRESGYRLYGDEALKKIRFIKNAQALGFTLVEISKLLQLRVSHRAHCRDVKSRALAKLKDVQAKIASLKALERTLLGLIRACQSRATTDQCPILKSLEIEKGRKK